MLEYAAVGFVPANATSDILQRADVCVGDNDHHAIAQVIDYLDGYVNT